VIAETAVSRLTERGAPRATRHVPGGMEDRKREATLMNDVVRWRRPDRRRRQSSSSDVFVMIYNLQAVMEETSWRRRAHLQGGGDMVYTDLAWLKKGPYSNSPLLS